MQRCSVLTQSLPNVNSIFIFIKLKRIFFQGKTPRAFHKYLAISPIHVHTRRDLQKNHDFWIVFVDFSANPLKHVDLHMQQCSVCTNPLSDATKSVKISQFQLPLDRYSEKYLVNLLQAFSNGQLQLYLVTLPIINLPRCIAYVAWM